MMIRESLKWPRKSPWRAGLVAIAVLGLFGGLISTSFASQARDVYVLHTDERGGQAHVIIGHDHTAFGMAHYVEHLTWLNAVSSHERSADRHSNAWTNNIAISY